MQDDSLRVHLVHDWLTGMRGGEKCLEVLCQRYPSATLHTLLHVPGSTSPAIEQMRIRPSFLQRIPGIGKNYRYCLPIMPWAARWPIADCDVLVSLSHCMAKAAKPPQGVPHVCYCFTPMRYAWHMREAYFQSATPQKRGIKGYLVDRLMARLRDWDRKTASRVTHFIAISKTIQDRIRECYHRDSTIIYPPADTEFYTPDLNQPREDYYFILSAFAPYKRLDLAIEACNRLQRRLVIIGNGQDDKKLRALAGPTIEFLGWQSDETIRNHMRRCKALLFPGEEDFGIVPVEANACGTPVIAFARGGATETVIPLEQPGATGVWFTEQTIESLIAGMQQLERHGSQLDPLAARRQAQRFNRQRFENELVDFIEQAAGRKKPTSRAVA